jgi:DNA-binding NarL/FixJ family response regulator
MTDDEGKQRDRRADPLAELEQPPADEPGVSHALHAAGAERAGTHERVTRVIPTHSERFDLGLLWTQLAGGRWRVVDAFCASERCYLMVEQSSLKAPRWPSRGRGLRMIERVLLGESPKAIAIDVKLSASTVASAMKRTLELMGLKNCRISGIPILMVLAARAANAPRGKAPLGFIAPVYQNDVRAWVVSAWRPDLDLPKSLSSAEQVVLRLLLEGRGHYEISRLRGTSTRTVANQLSTVFRKLGVSGRAQAVDRLAALALSAAERKRETLPPVPHVSEAPWPDGNSERSFAPNGFSQSGFFERSGAGAAGVALGTGTTPDGAGVETEAAPGSSGAEGADLVKPLAASGDDSDAGVIRPFSLPEPAAARGAGVALVAAGRESGPPVVVGAASTAGFPASLSGEAGGRVTLRAGAFAGAKDWIAK